MKRTSTLAFLMLTNVVSFSQDYYIYTAKKSGRWDDANNWAITVRTDDVKKSKVIIPASFNIVTDNNVNSLGLGDVDIQVSGGLTLLPNTVINLSNNSTISIVNSGTINGSATNQQIKIGSVVKYNGRRGSFRLFIKSINVLAATKSVRCDCTTSAQTGLVFGEAA